MHTALILACLAATALAVPTGQRTTCALTCSDAKHFSYVTGKSYVYEYSVTTSTALLGTFEDDARMHITANAHIDVTAPCEYTLRLTEVTLDGSSHAEEFAAALTKSPLRFSFQDGRVESVCSEVSEPAWVLNIKRGVLSTFQSSINLQLEEEVEGDYQGTDISGTCLTHYKHLTEGNVVTVEKIKDLSSCIEGPELTAYIATKPYENRSPSSLKSLPIFNSTNKCSQRIEEGVLKIAECEETHKYRPFSSEEGGAVTTAKTTLSLVSQDGPAVPVPDYEFVSKSLAFEQTAASKPEAQVHAVEEILNDLEMAAQDDIRPEVPALFSNLVASLKSLDYPTLSTVYTNTIDLHSRKFLLDAMPLVGTAASVGVVKDMFMSGDMTVAEADVWFTSLAFFKNPTSDMFTALVPLLEHPTKQAMLGTSALVNTYCKLHSDCGVDPGVQQVLRAIETQLGSGCAVINEAEKMKVLVALKGLRNAGHWVNATPILQRCYTEDNDMEIRVAAVEAWRHTPCEYDRSNLLAAFQDETQDPEVRIAAYLAVITCPTPTVIDTIKDRLTSESVNQVGSFIWTHMTNLQESAAPGKQWAREMIGEELLQKKFSTDALKFSRNYESSFFMNELNAGAAVESNVIFSSKSFLPRSAMLDLTLDLFGESINLFEVGGRMEGFEAYVERFFGPNGYFPEETVEGILKNMREQKPDAEATTLEGFLDKVTDEPEGSYYLRVFGNELYYNHFHSLEELMKTSGTSNPLEVLMDLARRGDVDYTKSYQLIDTHYAIPTVSGLPLTLTAQGIATVALKMNGNFKAENLRNINIEGHFHPSAAVQMDGLMVVDAHVTRTGLKISSTLHTSTFLDGKVQIEGGKLVDIALQTPKEKVEVIDVSTKFFYLADDQEIQKDVENQVIYDDCSTLLGVAICTGLSYTPSSSSSPIFPYTGPLAAHVYLKKTDTQTGYIFHFTREENEIALLIDTPESQVDHKVSLAITMSEEAINVDLHTPLTSAQGVATYVWEENDKSLKVQLTPEGSETYTLETGLRVNEEGVMKLEPSLVLASSSGQIINIHGSFAGQIADQISIISSKVDIEYSLTGENTHMIHHSALVKKELSDLLTTYSAQFELTPTEFANMALAINLKTLISAGRVESTGKLTHGATVWDVQEILYYSSENGNRNFNIYWAINCPAWEIDYLASQKVLIDNSMLRTESHVRIGPGKDYAINFVYSKVEDGHYKAQISGTVGEESWVFDGTLMNKSVPGKINAVVDGSFKSSVHDIKINSGLFADNEKATADLKINFNGQDYTLLMEGTRTSILVDINVLKHILVNAYVAEDEEAKKLHVTAEWEKDVDPTKALVIDGLISPVEVLATAKFAEREISASGKILDTGVETKVMWAPNRRVLASVHYSLGDTKTLAATVETPFPGWEKQDATFTVSVKDYEITSRAAVTWKNTEQMSLTINGKLQPGLLNNALNTEILFNSNFASFERISFTLDHTMAETTINTNVNGLWNDSEMKGTFHLTPNENGVDASATFTSPFTEETLVSLHHEFVDTALSTSLEAKYGAEVSTITLIGQVETGEVQTSTLELKIRTPITTVPEIDGNIKYTYDGTHLVLVTEGKVGEKKIMLNVNGEKTITEGSTAITGDLRFITPFTSPVTVTLAHSYDGQQFTTQSEVTGIWFTSGTVKMHAEGHMISREDVELTASMTTPDNSATLSINHKIADNHITSAVDATVNEERITISLKGLLDTVNTLVNLQADIISTFTGLEDIKANIESQRSDNTWVSKVSLVKDTLSVNIDHNINYTDILNWENLFIVNNIYKLRNKMTHVDTAYTHEMEYMWNSDAVHVTGTIDPRISENSRQINAQVIVGTSWTENIKVDLHHEDDGVEYKPTLVIEYTPGSIIEIATVTKSETSSFYIESTLTTPFWQPLGCRLNLAMEPQKAITLGLIYGANTTTVDVSGNLEDIAKMGVRITVNSTYLTQPVTVEAAYDLISPEKMVHFAVTTEETYGFTGSFSGPMDEAKWSLVSDLPFEVAQHIRFIGEYRLTMPLTINALLTVNTMKYEVKSLLNANDLLLDMDINGQKANLTGKWSYEEAQANIEVKFQSPVLGETQINFNGNLADPLAPELVLNIITPFEALKMLGGEAHWNMTDAIKTAEVKAYVNDIHYNWQLEAAAEGPLKGYATSKIVTPITGWTAVSVEGNFDFTAMPYKAAFVYDKEGVVNAFEAQLSIDQNAIAGEISIPVPGWEKIALNGDFTYENNHLIANTEFLRGDESYQISTDILFNNQPKLKVNIKTPLTEAANVELIFDSNIDTQTSLHVTLRVNDITYSANLTSQLIHKTGFVNVIASSPIPGYTTAEVLAKYDFTGDVKKADMVVKIEGEVQNFSVDAQVNDNNVQLDILTPFEGFETVKMVGDYTVVDGQHRVLATMERTDEKFDFRADFSLKNRTAFLKLTTPIPSIKNVQVRGKVEILNTGADCLVHIQKNEDKFAVKAQGKFTPLKLNLHLGLETPLDELKNFMLDVKYDLISDIKRAEISLQKDEIVKVIRTEASFNLERGSFKIETPFEGFEALGAEYALSVDMENKTLDASIKIHLPSEDLIFSAHGVYDIQNIKIELTTPFETLKLLSMAAKYNWAENNKDVTVNIIYNENNYFLTGTLNKSARASDFTLRATTPFPNMENVSVMAKYDIDNVDELVAVHTTVGEHKYNFLVAGYIEENRANFKLELTSPIGGWSNVKFVAKADFTNDDNMVEIFLEKEENVKAIAISGKLIGSTIDFNLKTPIPSLNNLGLSGSLDRAKRSLEFKMMSDEAEASLVTSFHSVKIHLKTPFARAEELLWEITKINERTYKAEMRRNDNYVVISVEKHETQNVFSVKVESELQGWEYLALAGMLDAETFEGYTSGAITEEKIIVSGTATFGAVGNMELHVKTPLEEYKTLDAKLEYDTTMLSAKIEISSSSELHIVLGCNPDEGITGHLNIPNPEQNTDVSINLGIHSGEITITSPFESLRNFHHEYHIQNEAAITAHSITTLNDEEIFKLDLTVDILNNKAQLHINAHIPDHETTIHCEHDGYSSLILNIRVQGVSTDQQFKIDVSGAGDLPAQGTVDIIINNTFLEAPLTIKTHVELDMTQERKHLKIEVMPSTEKLYKAEIDYAISNTVGDVSLRITTPDRMFSPLESISGKWNIEDLEQAHIELTIGEITYTAHGKLGIYESDLVLTPNIEAENILLQWRILQEENDYYLKVGPESGYGMLKLKGTFSDISHVAVEGGFKAGPFMANELLLTSQWNMGDDGSFATEGTFIYGEYHGQHHLEELNRDAETHSATFAWSATSNIPEYNAVSVAGNYDFNNKVVIYGLIKAGDHESKIDINFAELYPEFSYNTAEFHLPGLPVMQFTLSHDLRDIASMSVSAVARIGEGEQHIKAHGSRNELLDVLNGDIEIKTIYLGDIHITMNYDVSNAADGHVEVKYSREIPNSEPKYINIKLIRKMTPEHFESELLVDSTFNLLTHVKVYAKADYTDNFHLSSGIEWNENIITFVFDMTSDGIHAKLTTPFVHFEAIEAQTTYNLSGKMKKVTVMYVRGENKVHMDLTLDSESIEEGIMELTLTTPFEMLKYLHIHGTWKNKTAQVTLQRNDTQYSMEGTIDITVNTSSFDLSFTVPGWEVIRIAASYNVNNFLAASGTENEKLASLLLHLDEILINFNIHGFRNSEGLHLEIHGDTSFDILKIVHFKLDSAFTAETSHGDFEVQLNELKFKSVIHYEIRGSDGYYLKSKLESSIPTIPPVTIGFGRNGEERIVTVGYGDDSEVTVSIQGKDGFMSGFLGTIAIPNYGYEKVNYDVSYGFEGDNELLVSLDLQMGEEGEKVEAKFVYDSEGVKARLTSPLTGDHSMRVRRSVTEDSFSAEAGIDDYIAVSGRLIGSTIDFNLKTPIPGLNNLGLSGSLDRAKRSLEFKMMSDEAEASLVMSFHSVKIHLKTPFARAEELLWEITKINERTYKAEMRRNDNYVVISVEKHETQNVFSVKVESELQGWEYLALAGMLDAETFEGYTSGAITEEKIIVSGTATFGAVGNMELHVKTPLEEYKTLDAKLEYDTTMLSAKIEISSSSELHIVLGCNPDEGITGHLNIPNPEQNTDVSINLGIHSGEITITSPFESLRNFHHEYHIQNEAAITAHSITTLNDEEIFKLDLTVDILNNKAQLHINAHIPDHETTIHCEHDGYSSLILNIRVQGVSTDQQFKIDVSGAGDLPAQGTVDIIINNTFLEAPLTIKAHVELDMTQERKHLKIEVIPSPEKLYKAEIDYAISNTVGDVSLRITTPDRMFSPLESISGKWNIEDLEQAHIELTIGEITYTAHGKLGIYESDLVLTPNIEAENILLQWRILQEENDYYLKVGPESGYGMLKLKGTFSDIAHVAVEGGFKAGPFMANELLLTSQWNMGDDGSFATEGTFIYGEYHGQHHLEELNRDAETHSATFAWSATSNIPEYNAVSVAGNYDFNNKVVIYGLIKAGDHESKIDINFAELYPEFSYNTAEFHLPGLPVIQFTLSHDLRDIASMSVSAVARIGGGEQHIKAHGSRNELLDVLNGDIEIKTIYLGDIHITMNYDVSNTADGHVEVKYSREIPNSEPKYINIKLIRKMTPEHFESELLVDSTFNLLTHVKVYAKADYTDNFHLSSGIEWNENIITYVFDMTSDGIHAKLTTPFVHFEAIEAQTTYNLSGKMKKVTVMYVRGENKVHMDLTLDSESIEEGIMELTLTTPFEVLKYLHIQGTWKNKTAQVTLQRNDTQYSMEGTIDITVNTSSFDLSFTVPGWEVIRIAVSYNVDNFLAASGTENEKLASLLLHLDEILINFNIQGFRNSEGLHIEIHGDNSFDILKIVHFKLDSAFTAETSHGDFEVQLNELKFKSVIHYEIRGSDGYYLKSKLESSIPTIPPITIGFGRNGEERIVTVGYGDDSEVTVSIQGKDGFMSGFLGTIAIPNYGYEKVSYDVSYGFEGDNELLVGLDLQLGEEGEKVEAKFVYDSEGVKARLTSPLTGDHSMRVRRSVTEDGFSAEAGIDDYNVKLRGGFKDEDTKRGALLEGDIFGNKFLVDFLFQSEGLQYSEGKLIIQTPFLLMENMGGLFTLSNVDNTIAAHAEVLLPSYTTKLVLKCNLAGTSLSEGYQGTVEILTPFDAVPSLLVNVGIKMVESTSLEVKLTINDSEITAEFTMTESTFKFNLDTLMETVHRQLSIEAKYPSLENMEGTIIVMLGDEAHKIHGNFIILSNRVQGGMELESNLVEGPRKLNFDISLPNASYDLITFDVSLTTSETYSLFLELDTTAGIIGTVKVDTPILPRISATIELAAAAAGFTVETPEGIHKSRVTWRLTNELPADWLVTLELSSPLLTEAYVANLMLSGDTANMVVKAELQVGEIRHAIDGNIVMTNVGGELSLDIQTPYKDINRLALALSLSFEENIQMHITATYADITNTFDMSYNTGHRNLIALVKSPLIPLGQVGVEAQFAGNMDKTMRLKMALKHGENTIGGVLSVNVSSPNYMNISLKVTTPFKGYKKMNFFAHYKKDEITTILLKLDRPLKFFVELHLSNEHDRIMADVTVETPIENFERVHAKITVPLTVIAPSFSVLLDLEDAIYDAYLDLRTKPPYELGLGYRGTNMFSRNFHLRTDSSFLTLLP